MTLAFPLFAVGLVLAQTDAKAQPVDARTASPQATAEQGDYRAIGTEPFWDLTIGRDLVFTDRGTNVEIVQPLPPLLKSGANAISYSSRRLRVTITHAKCSDGMSERTYPDTVDVTADGRLYRGCGAPASFFVTVDERGNPQLVSSRPGPSTALERTRWRAVRLNGQALPRRGDYSIDFDGGRIVARFGCNIIRAPYSQTGTTIDAAAIAVSRMACPNIRRERQALAILDQVMTVRVTGRNRLTLASSAGTIDLVRR